MRWRNGTLVVVLTAVGTVLCAVALAARSERKVIAQATGVERVVTEAEVPEAALETLRKLAARAKITEFAEGSEEGHVFYEGSWETAFGVRMDVLVTRTGALVEIEESVEGRHVPAVVRELALKFAGWNVPLVFEKTTTILYEGKFEDADGLHELLLTPDGRCVEEKCEKGDPNSDDDGGDKEEEHDDQMLSGGAHSHVMGRVSHPL
jgi:hypothetical protein